MANSRNRLVSLEKRDPTTRKPLPASMSIDLRVK